MDEESSAWRQDGNGVSINKSRQKRLLSLVTRPRGRSLCPHPPFFFFFSFKRLSQAFAAGSCWRQDTGRQRCWPNPAQPPFHGASCSCSLGSEVSNCPHLPQKQPKPQHRLPGGGQGTQQPRSTGGSTLPLSPPRAERGLTRAHLHYL